MHTVGHHHGPGLPADLPLADHLVVEMVHHDLGLERDGGLVVLYVSAQLALGAAAVELRVVLDGLDQLVVAVDLGVVGQYIQDETLLDGLLHGV